MIVFSSKAYELIDLLTEADQASVERVRGIVKEVQDKFFSEYNLPMPEIKIRDLTAVKWLAKAILRVSFTDKPRQHVLEVQKAILGDDETLKRVITHEMIHVWQHQTGNLSNLVQMSRLGLDARGHGKDFHDWAEKINAVMGPNYVNLKSDETYKIEYTKEYYILIQPHFPGGFYNEQKGWGWSWAARPSAEQKKEIDRRIHISRAKLFKVKDPKWQGRVMIKQFGGYSIPKKGLPTYDEIQKELEQIYNSGKEITV
jgi:hypothetical protein